MVYIKCDNSLSAAMVLDGFKARLIEQMFITHIPIVQLFILGFYPNGNRIKQKEQLSTKELCFYKIIIVLHNS